MKIGKEFTWEMSHRLPFHKGLCKNIHGHSYKLLLELEGSLGSEAMILDFYNVEMIVKPLIELLDHSFVCDKNDELMINFLKGNGFKHYILDSYSTCENLATFFAKELSAKFKKDSPNIEKITVRVYETADSYAETSVEL